MPDSETLAAYYDYETYGKPNYEEDPGAARAKVEMFTQFVVRAERQLGRAGSLLDLGSSVGHLLEAGKARGWSVTGIEVDPVTAERTGQRLKVPVYAGSAVEVLRELGSFDLIAMSHWLEHLPNPSQGLSVASEHLTREGVVLIRVPNARSQGALTLGAYWPWYCPPIHLFYFSGESLRVMAKYHELAPLWIETMRGDAQPLPFEFVNGLYRRMFVRIPGPDDPPPTSVNPAYGGLGSVGGKRLGVRARPLLERFFPFASLENTELRAMLQRAPSGNAER